MSGPVTASISPLTVSLMSLAPLGTGLVSHFQARHGLGSSAIIENSTDPRRICFVEKGRKESEKDLNNNNFSPF